MILTYTVLYRFNLLLHSLITILKFVKVIHSMSLLVQLVLLRFLPLSLFFLPLLPFLVLLFLLHFFQVLQSKSFELLLLPIILFLFFLVLVALTLTTADMCFLVLVFNKGITLNALVRFVAAHLVVVCPVGYLDHDATELTCLGLECTVLIMILELKLGCLEIAMGTCNDSMEFFFVIFLLSLGYAHAALFALVVGSSATDLVHSELGHFDLLFAKRAKFCFDRTFFSFHFY